MVSFSVLKKSKSPEAEKKAFTEPEMIAVPALFNKHQVKKRLSFMVEADVILAKRRIQTAMAMNDPPAKVGVMTKPTESVQEMMKPFEGQTWHKKATPVKATSAPACLRSQSSATRSSSNLHVTFSGMAASAPPSRSTSAHTSRSKISIKRGGVRNMSVLEQALDALEEIEAEIQDLKEVMTACNKYDTDTRLTEALTRLAAEKRSVLKGKAEMIHVEGEGSNHLKKLRARLLKRLDALSKDWSAGGLTLNNNEPAKINVDEQPNKKVISILSASPVPAKRAIQCKLQKAVQCEDSPIGLC